MKYLIKPWLRRSTHFESCRWDPLTEYLFKKLAIPELNLDDPTFLMELLLICIFFRVAQTLIERLHATLRRAPYVLGVRTDMMDLETLAAKEVLRR